MEYEGRRDETILEWVFGETGRRVKMNGHSDIAGYEIIQAGEVRYTTTGKNGRYHYIPETHRMIVLGDAHGYLERRYEWTPETYEGDGGPDVWWADPSTPLAIGWWYGRGNVSGKYAQLYDARVDVDGLSFTFIPNGDNGDRYRTFFQGNTATPPYIETSLDEDSRCFTIRLYNTTLESGDYVPEYTSPLLYSYPEGPHSFPAGSLGRDNHFLTDAQITQDGEDAVVTCTLTEKARRVTVECGDLANQDIPSLRIVFREYVWHMDDP